MVQRCEHFWDETRSPWRCQRCGDSRAQNGAAAYPAELDDGDDSSSPEDQSREHVNALLFGPELARELEPLSHLVAALGLVAGGGAPHLIAGYGYSGKSLAMQSLLLSLAAGRAVWGVHTVAPQRVIHVDLEQGERLTRARYQRLAYSMGLDLTELGDAIAVSPMPRLMLVPDHRAHWRALMYGRAFMLIDSLRAATGGQDENSSDIRVGLDMLGALSEETGCRASLIHHARKPGIEAGGSGGGAYSIRGSGAIFDACDSVYVFSAEKGEPVSVEHVKARTAGELADDFALTIADEFDEQIGAKVGLSVRLSGIEAVQEARGDRLRHARQAKAAANAEAVIRALSASPGLGSRDLRSASGLGADSLSAALLHLGNRVEVRPGKKGQANVSLHYLTGSLDE